MTAHLREPVGTVAHRPPVFVEPDETLRAVAALLWIESVDALIVGDAHDPRGVISEGDVITRLRDGADPDVVTAGEAMTGTFVAVRRDDPVLCAASILSDGRTHEVAVINESGVVVATVSGRDLLRPLLLAS